MCLIDQVLQFFARFPWFLFPVTLGTKDAPVEKEEGKREKFPLGQAKQLHVLTSAVAIKDNFPLAKRPVC